MATYRIINNKNFNSKELYFDGVPAKETRDKLKGLKFRWNNKKMCWYGFANDEQIEMACKNEVFIPEIEKTEIGTIYEGWRGGKNKTWTDQKELKKLIIADLKKCGIKASLCFRRAGYLTAFTLTVTIKAENIKDFETWKNDSFNIDFYGWNLYTNEAGKIETIHGEQIDTSNTELLENIAKTEYKKAVEHLATSGIYNKAQNDVLTKEGNNILAAVCNILDSYNSDNSNGQIDYFDRAFYDHIAFKIA